MRTELKIGIVAAGLKHMALALRANKHLPAAEHLSELDVTKLITCRKTPTLRQAKALARVLRQPVSKVFPGEVQNEG